MRRYKAFISYSWSDKKWAGWLHRSLETYHAPKGVADGQTLSPIFKDREEEAAGGSVGAAIEAALSASDFLIVICSPRSARSTWVNREIAWFKANRQNCAILALIVDGEPGGSQVSGREAEECFPPALTHKIDHNLQPTDEQEETPLAADARLEGDGKRGAKLKLAAALLGVGLDELVRRDARRRTIRRRMITSAAFGLATALGALSIFAFNQRDAAILSRNEAVKARDDAEGLIELILTDLKADLEGFGTLKSVTAIGNRAIGYYEGQDVKALSADQLGRRARILLMLGEADNKRGDLAAALARYQAAAATTSEQIARDPQNPQRIFDHAQSVFWVGYIAWQRGDRGAAKIQLTEYHRLAQSLVAADPANEDWQAELDYAYSNLGTLAMDEGDAREAEIYFRQSLELALARLATAPEDIERIKAAGQSYAWLADASYFQINLTDAIGARQAELAVYKKAQAAFDTPNRDLARLMAIATYSLAVAAHASGDYDKAFAYASDAERSATALFAADPTNSENANRAIYAGAVLGETAISAGRMDDARLALETSLDIGAKVLGESKDASRWLRSAIAQNQLLLARIEASQDRLESALALHEEIIRNLQPIVSSDGSDVTITRRYCAALADKAKLSGNASTEWSAVASILAPLAKRLGPEGLTLLAEAYSRTGQSEKARAIATRLDASGYRHPEFIRLSREFPSLTQAARK